MPKRSTTMGLTGLLFLALLRVDSAVVWSQEVEESLGEPKRGRNLFVSKGCIRCHSVWARDEKKGPSLASVGMGRNLYELTASVWSHWSQMNAVLQKDELQRIPLTADNLRDIIAYIYYLNYFAEPGDQKQGREVFLGKGCNRCHALEPLQAEGKPGMAVYEMVEFQTPIALAVAVWNHGHDMTQRMQTMGIPWPRFKDKEVADLVAFIRNRTRPVPRREMEVPGDFKSGQSQFRAKSCANCHGPGGRGSARGPDLVATGTPASLSSMIGDLWNHYPTMAQVMTASSMPAPRFSKMEMENLMAFIYWVKTYGLEGDAAEGRKLYQSKQCASCHASADRQAAAPELVGSKTTQSVYMLLASIWNHGPKMETLLRERNLDWPQLTGKEMRDLIAYFRMGKSYR